MSNERIVSSLGSMAIIKSGLMPFLNKGFNAVATVIIRIFFLTLLISPIFLSSEGPAETSIVGILEKISFVVTIPGLLVIASPLLNIFL